MTFYDLLRPFYDLFKTFLCPFIATVGVAIVIAGVSYAAGAGVGERLAAGSFYSRNFGLIRTIKGIRIYKHKESEIVHLAAEARFPVPAEALQKALVDYKRQPEVMRRLIGCEVMRRGQGWVDVYQRLDLPFLDDRDYTMETKWGGEGAGRWVYYKVVDDPAHPPVEDAVRIQTHNGWWDIQPLPGGAESYARFEMKIDIAGNIPRWLAKATAGSEILDLFRSLCKLAGGEVGGDKEARCF